MMTMTSVTPKMEEFRKIDYLKGSRNHIMHPSLSGLHCGTFARLIVLTTILLQFVESKIVERPSNTTAMLNESTYFSCSTSIRPVDERSITWFHYPLDRGGDRSDVYADGRIATNYMNRFTIDKNLSFGALNLLALRLEPNDAGRYECTDDVHADMGASAELTVLGTGLGCDSDMDPDGVIGPTQCDTAIAPDELQLSCRVTYIGNNAPQMIWRKSGDSLTPTETDCVNKDNRVTCNTTLTASLQLNGAVYSCELTTQQLYTCSLEISKMLYVYSSNATTNIAINEEVTCSANSSQPCSYKWKWFNESDSLTVSINQTLKPTSAGSHRCEATCPIGNTLCTVDVMFAEVHSTQSPGASTGQFLWVLWLVLGIIWLIALIAVGLYYCWRPRNGSNREEPVSRTSITTYSDNPKLVTAIDVQDPKSDPKKKKRPIFGMTILLDKLYVVTEKSSAIEVYDSVTFNHETNWEIAGMSNPIDIASCSINNCLYICDSKSKNELTILRVVSSQKLLKSWSIEEEGGHLSVTKEGNVIVSLFNGNKIIEYSAEGDVIGTVTLSPADNISHPWHAIKTTSMHFIFSHGFDDDLLHRVCVANADGKILKSFGGRKGSGIKEKQMNRPVHLLEDGSRNVLVADTKNKRVVLLSPTLEFKRILVPVENGHKLTFPMRLCLDEKRGILFVADNYRNKDYDGGRILIFSCKT